MYVSLKKGRKLTVIKKAIAFATKAHEGQMRKGTTRPFITHPLEVAQIVSTMTEDKEVICAAILHDTIEDCEGVTEDNIREEFTERIAELVAQESEDKSKTWMERKSHTIAHLKVAPKEIQMIGLADKLSNMRDIDRDYPECGEELWNRFRTPKEDIRWYYREKLLASKGLKDHALTKDLFFESVALYEEIFEDTLLPRHWR